MAFPLLNISPSQLEFLFEAERELKSTLNLRNVNEGVRVAFKIKTTNSERFVVCPPTGIVEPGTTRIVKIYLKAQRDYDEDLRLCKDRFLVQSIQVDEELQDGDVASGMFRSAQRQEAKLKVVVAAPLAHSSVLENEIRTIAQRQGIEGHRAAVRKFSELLLARGIISQAQVVLAFSTVGEIFQGMHGSLRVERDFDYNNIPVTRGTDPSADPSSQPGENGVAALATRRADDFTPTPRGAAPADGPFRLQSAALFTAVGPRPQLDTGREAALHTALGPPANGGPGTSQAASQQGVFTAAPEAAAKAEAIYSSAGSGGLAEAAAAAAAEGAAAAPPQTPPAAAAGDQPAPLSASESASPDQQRAAPEPRATDAEVEALFGGSAAGATEAELEKAEVPKAEGEKAEVGGAVHYATPAGRRQSLQGHSNGHAEDDTDLAFQATGGSSLLETFFYDGERRANKPTTKRLLRPRRTVGELREAPLLGANAEQPKAAEAAAAPIPVTGAEGLQELQLDKQQSLSGRANWPAGGDTLGRLNPVTRIDRLATPAYRKTSLPAASRRIDAVLANAQSSARADEESARRSSTGVDSGAFASPTGSHELESQQSIGSAADVPAPPPAAIPRGNTLKMATLFGRGRQ